MAYRDDLAALGADHHWDFDGDSLDQIGSVNGTDTSIIYTDAAIAEDATNCATTNAVGDRISLPTTININNSAQARKAFCLIIQLDSIQPPPKRLYGEGNDTTFFQFLVSIGNASMFEVGEPTNFTVQVYGPVFQPNRSYSICGIFEGNGFGNEVKYFVDGVKQTLSEPADAQPDSADLNARGVGEFGDPAGTVGVGGGIVLLQAPTNLRLQHGATFDGVNAELTDTEVREVIFEKGALPGTTIASGTEAAMQTSLDALADTVRGDEPLNIRVSTVTGDGDLSLTADNITHDALASTHVQYMGTGILTWRNDNGSDASIGSTPNVGTIVFAKAQILTVTVQDISDNSAIQSAVVRIIAAAGGDLVVGTEIMNATTNASGVATQAFDFTNDQPFTGEVRKHTTSIFYDELTFSGTLISVDLDTTVFMVPDE